MKKCKAMAGVLFLLIALCLINITITFAQPKGTILLVPHDDRPTSGSLSAEAPELLGYNVKMPPLDMLGGLSKVGKPAELTKWILDNSKEADGAVIAADSVIYGGLVASRRHELSDEELLQRAELFHQLKILKPDMKIMAFSSLMRTPMGGAESGGEEPDYYMEYGSKIFRRSGLLDLAETRVLSDDESTELDSLERTIPSDIWEDWYQRRKRNLLVTEKIMGYTEDGTLDYYVVGKDDNAPLSATHKEARYLKEIISRKGYKNIKLLSGIDEFAMLLMARTVNSLEGVSPSFYVEYGKGPGEAVVPKFSDEAIGYTISEEIEIAGSREEANPEQADIILMVNTDIRGRTGDGHPLPGDSDPMYNDGLARENTRPFLDALEGHIAKGRKVSLADIAFANGADNALMNGIRDRELLFKLWGYAGWNTATNSSGFVIGQSSIGCRLPKQACNYMLFKRYLDDWVYQSNVREALSHQLPSWEYVFDLKEFEPQAMELTTRLVREFALKNKLELPWLEGMRVTFPWHRPFIGSIEIK